MRTAIAYRLLWIDSLGGLGVGYVVMVLHDVLADLYGLPGMVVAGIGMANLAYGCMSGAMALTPRLRRPWPVGVLIAANVAWGGVCAWLLQRYGAEATVLGVLTVSLEGAYVVLLGLVEWWVRRDLLRTSEPIGPRWALLECRVPPPVVALLAAIAMHAIMREWPGGLPKTWRPAGIAIALSGAALALWAIVAFRRAATTIHPMTPHEASSLVIAGPNRWSRNPMYVGLLLVLVGWGSWLGSVASLLVVPLAWAWLRRFQVEPEERALAARFGEAYAAYRAAVRRWV